MGARAPPIKRPRRGGIKCEFCGRAVPSESALRSHQSALHSQALKEKSKQKPMATKSSKVQMLEQRKAIVKKQIPKPLRTYAKATPKKVPTEEIISKSEITKPKTDSPQPKADTFKQKTDISSPKVDNTKAKVVNTASKLEKNPSKATEMEVKKNSSTPVKVRKVEYKCPVCDKLFPVLFVAQKHIQKHHCVNSKGEKVAQSSPHIIQPILIELCIYCNGKFSKPHQCLNKPDPNLLTHRCLGCQGKFRNNKLFDLHVADVHGHHFDSLFFSCEEEFMKWKLQMELQTECKYILMGRYDSKKIYRCDEQSGNHTVDFILQCPSTIVSTDCPKGLQINFYPTHYQHNHKKYDLIKDQYKAFTITDLIQQAGHTNGSSDDDLYLQFKTLMESIVLDAAKINIGTLKTLMNKAMVMMSVLQEYDEDEEVETTNCSTISISTRNRSLVGDDNVIKPSEGIKTRKRGLEEKTPLKTEPEKKKPAVGGNISIGNKSNIPIGNKSNIPIGNKSNTFSLADDKDSDKILKELDSENIKLNRDKSSAQSPSFADTYKDFIKNVAKTATTPKCNKATNAKSNTAVKAKIITETVMKSNTASSKKKNVVKTKMGQFKGPSPKKVVKPNNVKISKDIIDYEVLEQEDDCNILVLKI